MLSQRPNIHREEINCNGSKDALKPQRPPGSPRLQRAISLFGQLNGVWKFVELLGDIGDLDIPIANDFHSAADKLRVNDQRIA